jgi:hypothetical protein
MGAAKVSDELRGDTARRQVRPACAPKRRRCRRIGLHGIVAGEPKNGHRIVGPAGQAAFADAGHQGERVQGGSAHVRSAGQQPLKHTKGAAGKCFSF